MGYIDAESYAKGMSLVIGGFFMYDCVKYMVRYVVEYVLESLGKRASS